MNPINNTDNELQRAIDDITKNAGRDNEVATGASKELENRIQNNMGTPPIPNMSGLPPVPPMGAPMAGMRNGGYEEMPQMAGMRQGGASMAYDQGNGMSMQGVQTGATAAMANMPETTNEGEGELNSVREAMMRDLFPLMDKVEMSAEQKYELYHEMIETTGDKSMVPAAYDAVKGITDDKEKAEALLYLLGLTNK